MEKQNRYLGSISQIDPSRVFNAIQSITWLPLTEITYGIKSKSINWFLALTPGCVFNLLVLLKWDTPVFQFLKLGWLLPPAGPKGYLVYAILGAFSGMLAWGLWQAILQLRISRKLTDVFLSAGLKNAVGKLPGYIFDRPVDEYTRKLRLKRANLTLTQFQSAKESLESALQVFIDEIKEDREKGTVDITYASLSMPSEVKLSDISSIGTGKFFVGETRARKMTVDLDETPHFLVGGQSGGGKSTFLRQVITTLYLNNKSYQFVLIDLKGGLEFQLFENLKRVTVVPQTGPALDDLKRIEGYLKSRMEIFKRAECKDISAYLQKTIEEREAFEKDSLEKGRISRIVIVIDEAAELFMAGDKSQATKAQQAKTAAIKIAAQGRAVGIHLIIATQRPDVRAVDGQIKANLSGMLAFQMPNHASSMTILDNTRAAHLPKIPGRAIWKTGLEMSELQTPYMTVEEVSKLLEPFKEREISEVIENA